MDEGEAVDLIEQVCASLSKKPPKDIVFRAGPHSYVTFGRGGRIVLPRSSFIEHWQIAQDDCETRLLVLHETAHFLSGPIGHKPAFYVLLYQLCEQFGVPLAYAHDDEVDYRPRYAEMGWRQFQAQKEAPAD